MAKLNRMLAALSFAASLLVLFLYAIPKTMGDRHLEICTAVPQLVTEMKATYGSITTYEKWKPCSYRRLAVSVYISVTDPDIAAGPAFVEIENASNKVTEAYLASILPWTEVRTASRVVFQPRLLQEASIQVDTQTAAQRFFLPVSGLSPSLGEYASIIDHKAEELFDGTQQFDRNLVIHLHIVSPAYSPLVFKTDASSQHFSTIAQISEDSGIILLPSDVDGTEDLSDSLHRLLQALAFTNTAALPIPRQHRGEFGSAFDTTHCTDAEITTINAFRTLKAAQLLQAQCVVMQDKAGMVIPENIHKAMMWMYDTLQRIKQNNTSLLQRDIGVKLLDVAGLISESEDVKFDFYLTTMHYYVVIVPPWAPLLLPTILAVFTSVKRYLSRRNAKKSSAKQPQQSGDSGVSIRSVRACDNEALRQLYRIGQMQHMVDAEMNYSHTAWTDHVLCTDLKDAHQHYSTLPVGGMWVATIPINAAPVSMQRAGFWQDNTGHFIVGCIALIAPGNTELPPKTIELVRMSVHPHVRRMGVASRLIRYAENWAAQQGYEHVYLTTLYSMAPAWKLYLKNGFSFMGPETGAPIVYKSSELFELSLIKPAKLLREEDVITPLASPTPSQATQHPTTRIDSDAIDPTSSSLCKQIVELPSSKIELLVEKREAGAMVSSSDNTGKISWGAGQLLATLLAKHTYLCESQDVIEFGCGAALLGSVAAALGARSVVVTDANKEVLPLALHNVTHNSCNSTIKRCAQRLVWNDVDDEMDLMCAHPIFTVALAAEVFYHHRGEGNIEEQAFSLFTSARRLLDCYCQKCMDDEPSKNAAVWIEDKPTSILLLVYTPRYPGMAKQIYDGAKRSEMVAVSLDREDVMTETQRKSLLFGRVRLMAVSRCEHAIARFLAKTGIRCAPRSDDEDDWVEEDCDLSNISIPSE